MKIGKNDKSCYLVTYMLKRSYDKYDLESRGNLKTSDHYVVYDGDLEEADKFYNDIRKHETTYSANLCLVLKSTEAYQGVHHEKSNSSTKESVS